MVEGGVSVHVTVDVQLVGHVRAVRGGETIELGSTVARTLLGLLALSPRRGVPRHRLVDAVWGEQPPPSAVKTLQAHISKLRRELEPDRTPGDPGLVAAEGDGYRLELDPAATDIGRFRHLAASADSAAAWRRALRTVAGSPLAGCLETPLVLAERAALEEELLTARESWAAAELAEGRPEAVLGDLERLVAAQPLRERSWALLVRALGAASRQADALAAYRRARTVLVDEVGAEPGPELRAAERAVLDQKVPPAPLEAPGRSARGLPAPRTSLVGRDGELARLHRAIVAGRLVTITGPGGTGKTRLALEAARAVTDSFPGGAVLAELTSVAEPHEVVHTVAAAAGLRMMGEADELEHALAGRLGGEPALLLLDNCEHVVSEVARLVDRLLDEAEHLVVLATSRRPLEVGGEQVWPLAPLSLDDAAALFVTRADARRPGAGSDAPAHAVREVCRRLDALPLAIELAAARADHLTPAEIIAAMDGRLETLRRRRPVGAPDRHESLAATIRWSHDLLDAPARAVLRRLSVFRGPFDRHQAAAVAADRAGPDRPDDVLGELVAQSLVVAERAADGTRYHLLDTIRTFARGELDAHGETAEAERRHRDWYLERARRLPPGATVRSLTHAFGLERHHADLQAALARTERDDEPALLAELAVFAGGLAFCPGGLPDAERWLAAALERADELTPSGLADLLGVAATTAGLRFDGREFADRLSRVLPLVDQHPSGGGPFALVLGLADPSSVPGVVTAADDLLATAGASLQPDVHHGMRAMRVMATLSETLDPAVALAEADAVWAGRAWSDLATEAAWTVHAALLHVTGDVEALRERLDGMERVPAELGPSTFFVTFFDAVAAASAGRAELALDHLRGALDQHWLRIPGVESDLLAALAVTTAASGDPARARRLLDRPGLRIRHPGTSIVHVDVRQRLGLSVRELLATRYRGPNEELAALLEDELTS